MTKLEDLKKHLSTKFDISKFKLAHVVGDDVLEIEKADLVPVLRFFRETGRFDFLMDICGVDYPQRAKRFDVVYHLFSSHDSSRLRIKVQLHDGESIDSAIRIWRGADWFEREAFDLYGILFSGHPDLRRILTDYGFSGHPLRKDFPVTGHVEVRYDDEVKRVVYEPVKLIQEMRQFDYLSPWEGTEYVLPGDEKAKQ